jgi:hypothetical protein
MLSSWFKENKLWLKGKLERRRKHLDNCLLVEKKRKEQPLSSWRLVWK